MAVAGHALPLYLDVPPPGMIRLLADWLLRHIALTRQRGPKARWQWELTVLDWVCEACGISELWLAAAAMASDLMAEAGFTARAMRQGPYHRLAPGLRWAPTRDGLPGLQCRCTRCSPHWTGGDPPAGLGAGRADGIGDVGIPPESGVGGRGDCSGIAGGSGAPASAGHAGAGDTSHNGRNCR